MAVDYQSEAFLHGSVTLGKETCGYRERSPRTKKRAAEVMQRMSKIAVGNRGTVPRVGPKRCVLDPRAVCYGCGVCEES